MQERVDLRDPAKRAAMIQALERQMRQAAANLEFELAAMLRDQVNELRARLGAGRSARRSGQGSPPRVIRTLTQAELEAEGETLGRSLPPGALLTFEGDLGAGKTTFIKAIARGLGVAGAGEQPDLRAGAPLSRRARGRCSISTASGLRTPDEAADLDWEGLLREGDAMLVEWPERAGAWLPSPTRRFRLHHLADPDRRGLEVL